MIVNEKLTCTWGATPTLVESGDPSKDGRSSYEQRQVARFWNAEKPKRKLKSSEYFIEINPRCPWDMIDMDKIRQCNFTYTVNPDILHEFIGENYNDRPYMNARMKNFLLSHNNLYKYCIGVYEYGDKGAVYGKLHYHFMFKTHAKDKLQKAFNQHFGTTAKRCNVTTRCKLITIDHGKKYSNPEEYQKLYYENIDSILHYFKKENQNKRKCFICNAVMKNNITNI